MKVLASIQRPSGPRGTSAHPLWRRLGRLRVTIRHAPPERSVKAVLNNSALPTSDITLRHLRHFVGCWAGRRLVGVVGLEPYGKVALLRSLAVRPQYRDLGLGRLLVASIEEHAHHLHVDCLSLLTTTAEKFFMRCDYEIIVRASAPAIIRATTQFRELCPANSVCMMKRLGKTEAKSKDGRPQ